MYKVLLVVPPDYDYNFPPLGTPALTAFLKKHDLDVRQQDLNLGYRQFLIRHLELEHSVLSEAQKKLLLRAMLKKYFYQNLRGRYYSRYLMRTKLSNLPLLPYDNNTNSSFYFTERLLSSPHLWRYLEDQQENTFLQYYQAICLADILRKEKVSLLGLSVISPSQAIPSLTLGYLVKKAMPDIQVVLGGQWVTLYRQVLLAEKEFFKCFDSFITFEGETALVALARAVERRCRIPIIQVIRRDSLLEELDHFVNEDLDRLPCPDFDGLPLQDYDEYTSCGTALTYETSRGCYWARCAYCVDLPLPKPAYRYKNARLVAEDMRHLKQKYKARFLLLGDPGMAPRQMREVTEAILENNPDLDWWCMSRLDEGFRRPVFKQARRAGLCQINFGFESASDRLCDLLDKGNRRARSARIIKDCHAAGILVDLQTIIGLPGETWAEALETVDFLVGHRTYIANVSFNIYYVTPANFVFQSPEKYDLVIDKKRILPFGFFIPFKNPSGLSAKEAYLLEKLYLSLVEKKDVSFQNEGFEEKRGLRLADEVVEDKVTLRLNGQKSRLYFLHNLKTGEITVIEDAHHRMLLDFKKGLSLRCVHEQWLKRNAEAAAVYLSFVGQALQKGFFEPG